MKINMMQLQSMIIVISTGSDNNIPNNDSEKRESEFHLLISQFGIYNVILEEPRKTKRF